MIQNPILSGFHPDPSIVRVGEDYYLATSTFVWQPGIRIFHSRDLATWTLVGHGLAPGVHDFRGMIAYHGVWAPCLTYAEREGLFYLVYSVMKSTGAEYFDVDNYLVTAADVRGPWSEPVYLSSIGFDPSFFHDADGRHWLVTLEWETRHGHEHPGAIVLEEYLPQRKALREGTIRISRGSSDRGCLEAPHLYRRDGWYYLMTAEGGTGFGHGAFLARSATIEGPYAASPLGPVLTSNPSPHFGRNVRDHLRPELANPGADLQKAGHGCLVDTPGGQWFVAHLCARPVGDPPRSILGRESAIQEVEWTDDGWLRMVGGGPVARGRTGGIRGMTYADRPPEEFRDDFDGPDLDPRLASVRRPVEASWVSRSARPGWLTLTGGDMLTSRYDVALLATPLTSLDAIAETRMAFSPSHFSQSAGLVVLYDEANFAYLRRCADEGLGADTLGIVVVEAGVAREFPLDRAVLGGVNAGEADLRAVLSGGRLRFEWRPSDGPSAEGAPGPEGAMGSEGAIDPGGATDARDAHWRAIGPELDIAFMSDEATRGFTGTVVGIACVDRYRRTATASFDYLRVRPQPTTGPQATTDTVPSAATSTS